MLYLHPESLSPDPTYGRKTRRTSNRHVDVKLFPNELLYSRPQSARTRAWARSLDIFEKPAELVLKPDANRRVDVMLDFGTELDGRLSLRLNAPSPVNLMACFGESEPEAAGLVPGHNPNPTYYWHIAKGNRRILSETRGFRFVRLVFSGVEKPLRLREAAMVGALTFVERRGDFHCSDKRFQRVWQSSVYTARVCTQENTIWDGPKRDRVGWYGDARISKLAVDNVFFDPRPAEAMLAAMPTDQWANEIPNYSFDGIAMLKQHILYYGRNRPCVRPCYQNFLKLLKWAWRTQVDREGLIIRTDHPYFGDMGFVDWSDYPAGGRFEELCWLQCKYLAALHNTRQIAVILGDEKTVRKLAPRIASLERLLVERFWNSRKGFIHTLNHIGRPKSDRQKTGWDYDPFENLQAGIHYRKTYEENVRLGPSGASRQSNALAVLAGLPTPKMAETILKRVFDNPGISPVITAYFSYYEQLARGLCGDPAGAVLHMRDFVGKMLEANDSATLWETCYDLPPSDLRRYFGCVGDLWTWPVSLCHGWGAGAVPLATQFLLGIVPAAPAFARIALAPCGNIPWRFTADVPTPRGIIHVVKEKKTGDIRYTIPKSIKLVPETQARVGQGFKVNQ